MFVNMKLGIVESLKYDGYSLYPCQRAACDLVSFGIQSVCGLTIRIVAFR